MDIAKIRKKLKKSEEDKRIIENIPSVKSPEEQDSTAAVPAVERPPEPEPILAGAEGSREPEKEIEKLVEPAQKVTSGGEEAPEPQKTEETKSQGDILEILTFSLLNQEFAFRISHLEEILRMQRITKLPKAPEYVMGITSLRGKIIPVMDLKRRLSLTDKPSGQDHKGKILIIKGPKGPIGIAVDKVIGVVRIEKSKILPPPSHFSEEDLTFIDGMAVVDRRFVSIINMQEAVALHLK